MNASAVNDSSLERVHGRRCDRDVVDDLRDGLPQRQEWQVFGIQRHDDGVAGSDLDRAAAIPAVAFVDDGHCRWARTT